MVDKVIAETVQRTFLQGLECHRQGKLAEAGDCYRRALALDPGHFDSLRLLGLIAALAGDIGRALALYDRAIAVQPTSALVHCLRADLLQGQKRSAEAAEGYDRALAEKPDFVHALYNRGNALRDLGRLGEAVTSYGRVLDLEPHHADVHNNRAAALHDLKRLPEAIAGYRRALSLAPDNAAAWANLGAACQDVKDRQAAAECFDKAIALGAGADWLYGNRLHARMHLADWQELAPRIADLEARVVRGEKATLPLPLLALSSSAALQRKASEIFAAGFARFAGSLGEVPQHGHAKLRIGYYSADLHDHATAYLMAELFERHDRSRFEITAFSFGPDRDDAMRRRLVAAFDRFVDVRERPDREIALLSRSLEIDIAVDLKGYTGDGRPGIFACRAAPLQIAWLGFPGTTGAPWIDYLVADPILIPVGFEGFYSEKIVRLPGSYQVNDSRRAISDRTFTRGELGLPATGFVFCCFNAGYKILPATFDIWMRLLDAVEDSVLWLLGDAAAAEASLRREAVARGIAAHRLVFAGRLPLAEHLARHRAADLFLDTLPCNAHTTASDALWAGLPVLTCTAQPFASRVSASLLHAVGLPELVTGTPAEYEALALALARDPGRLTHLGRTLVANRRTAPLFDAGLFARHLERAYTLIDERRRQGLPPDHINVGPTCPTA